MRFSKKGIAVLRLPSRRNTLRPIERPLAWLAGLALALCAGTAAGAAGGPSSVAFWYAERPPLAELSQFDWVVLEAAHLKPADVGYLKEQGSTPFAYLSVASSTATPPPSPTAAWPGARARSATKPGTAR